MTGSRARETDTPIDLRSDTVTQPTPGMRRAMAEAPVGDDVYGEDPSVNALQERVAALLGKEAALYVPSGTMSNQLALHAQTQPGDQIVLNARSHIYCDEAGAGSAFAGVWPSPVVAPHGVLAWPLVAAALNPDDEHSAPPALVCLENTHNRAGGRILPQQNVLHVAEGAHARGLRLHLDGARLWHVHVATGLAMRELAAPADSVSVCFSKGLGAPIGSVFASDRETIRRAHRYRKMLGGGMRQAGVLAAACLYALDHHVDRLAEDHALARRLADGLANPALQIRHPVDTNIVIFDVEGPGGDTDLLRHLEANGILGVGFGPGRVRLIPHLDTHPEDVERAIEALNGYKAEAR